MRIPLADHLHRAYRRTGADLPYGDPLRAHGLAMEGYFWRVTDADRGRVLVALIGVNQGPRGSWATLGLGTYPTRILRVRAATEAWADPTRVGAGSGSAFHGDDRRLSVDLGPDAQVDLRLHDLCRWPHRRFGGSSVFHTVPRLNQYWHPWLLDGRVSGVARLGEETWKLDGAHVYAEKNWGHEGFPGHWWWGQAHGFEDPGACLAFAGGEVKAGPLRTTVTALVVRLPNGQVIRLGDPLVSPVRARVGVGTWELSGRGYGWRIHVTASDSPEAAHVLPVPVPSEHRNVAGALEHLGGHAEVEVSRHGRVVWRGATDLAGLERGGLALAAQELRRRGVDLSRSFAPATAP